MFMLGLFKILLFLYFVYELYINNNVNVVTFIAITCIGLTSNH